MLFSEFVGRTTDQCNNGRYIMALKWEQSLLSFNAITITPCIRTRKICYSEESHCTRILVFDLIGLISRGHNDNSNCRLIGSLQLTVTDGKCKPPAN